MQETTVKCFCCDAGVHHTRVRDAWTEDGQHVWVGASCRHKIDEAKNAGFQPHKGGPRLFGFEPYHPSIEATVAAMQEASQPKPITRENVARYLDAHMIEVHMRSGAWWEIRRNGQTKLWKSQPGRIRLPYKYGLRGYGAITTEDFRSPDGRPLTECDPNFRDLTYGSLSMFEFRLKSPLVTRERS